ncbi:MarR family winged helix-turn-helix transcriptional regulator [Georgenia sp. AZ-5]|uniref:MarR family winged helix-turn-helix transcriptional regulator n=1 Tax=Georgenia sp. AZ-5 TaxID=3367526 RepID=UPI0037543E89
MQPSEVLVAEETPFDNIGLLLSLASAQGVAAANAVLRPRELSSRSYSLLELLHHADAVSQRGLADALRLDPSQIVSLVDGLERRGLVERRPNPDDRRQRSVVLTDAGRDVFGEARTLVAESLDEVLSGLSPEERGTLRALLQRVVRHGAARPDNAS